MRIWPAREAWHVRDVAVPNKVLAYWDDEDGEDGASGEGRKCQMERIRLSVSGKGASRGHDVIVRHLWVHLSDYQVTIIVRLAAPILTFPSVQ
jgi:hypothetical protein